jgi:hypothetical protein
MVTLRLAFLIVALLCFVAAAFGISAPVNLVAAGLAFWVGSLMA